MKFIGISLIINKSGILILFMTSPFEQGKQRGLVERKAIRHRLAEIYKVLEFFEMEKEILLKIDENKLKYVPERYLEECRGIAEGAGVKYEEIIALNYALMFYQLFRDGCTAFIIPKNYSTDGSVMLLKNRDLGFRRLHPQVLSYSRLDGYNSFIGITSAGSVCWYQGVNEKGLVAFNTATPCQIIDPTRAQGMSISTIIRRILEECNSVDDALKFISNTEYNACSNLFLADYERAVIIELKAGFSPYIWEISEPDCRSNHYLFHINPEVKDKMEILVRQQTLTRYARGKMLLKMKEKISLEDLIKISRDHFSGPGPSSICRHPPIVGSPLMRIMSSTTLSAQIFKLGEKIETYVALGYPCQSEFIRLEFGDEIPEALASGEAWLNQYKQQIRQKYSSTPPFSQ